MEGVAEGRGFAELVGAVHLILPELGAGFGEAAEVPLALDEEFELAALFGGVGLVVVEVFRGESFQFGGVFAADDEGFGINAGFQGVHAGTGFALGGAGTGAITCIFGAHKWKRDRGRARGGGLPVPRSLLSLCKHEVGAKFGLRERKLSIINKK